MNIDFVCVPYRAVPNSMRDTKSLFHPLLHPRFCFHGDKETCIEVEKLYLKIVFNADIIAAPSKIID